MSLKLTDIQKAQEKIQKYLKPTPLVRCETLEQELHFNGEIYLKCEEQQPTGSFKVRGAFNALSLLKPEERGKGVVTRSSGNFAQAVAFASQTLGIKATIVMPANAPKTKLEGTKKFGPTILISGNTHEDADAIVKQQVEEKGLTPLHPYNNYGTMAGQGTAALEILLQLPTIKHFFCPIGGGGLLSGCATAFKESHAQVKTYGIEPKGAGDYNASRQSGKRECWKSIETIADGLRAACVGELNYPILNKYVDESHVVTEDEIKKSMKWLYEKMQMIVEPSGAVSFAGFINNAKLLQGPVVILISGKNVDRENFDLWLSQV